MFVFKFKTEIENWREFGVSEGRPVELACPLPVERDEDENIPDLEYSGEEFRFGLNGENGFKT